METGIGIGIMGGLVLMLLGAITCLISGPASSGGIVLLSGCVLYGLTLVAAAIERRE